ncbi:MAG TPA: segregation/condensation protein A [Rhodospirillales bacterium]|jgi:segregation and condensation protein A|nr:MAG: Segregation and condensation protein A [Alphaproteobacteria bacterium MarineAlpha3_Bin2]HIE20842.1 segregation/condensation protein A [Rhodospirillales bacterium]HIM24595.1 segregation/condensation protein A [Rhodospirillales bacterium]HIM78384.1 segregation/condensation protein A [Rhodospirillales bacterium]
MEETETIDKADDFTDAAESESTRGSFVVDLDGYEGPIDVLLTLAREHKLDLTKISILALADQYLEFVAKVRRSNLELAADYLVMAAWLAYLKSRLLLPDLGEEDEPTGEQMAAALAFQLRRLEAMQDAGQKLMARSHLGREFFRRGAPETFRALINPVLEVTLYDLLRAYGNQKRRIEGGTLHIEAFEIFTVEDALHRLQSLLGSSPDWESLWHFLPEGVLEGLVQRSAIASTFTASLELAREGKIKLRQSGPFGPIYLKAADTNARGGDASKAEFHD